MSEHLQPIYDVWGGNAEAMAADIGELGVTVRQWRNRRDIPSRAWPKIIKAAAAKGKALRLEDFLAPDVRSDLAHHGDGDTPEWPIQSANNGSEIIGADAGGPVADDRDGGGGHGHPFPRSSATSLPTSAHPQPSPESQACSAGRADAG